MNNAPPAQLAPWLKHPGSITDKLKAYAGEARLQLLKHAWELTDTWDQQTLSLIPNLSVLHREILMWANHEPCWFARTILPKPTYQAEEALFSRLKTTPLGELIHHHPNIQRTNITPYPIQAESMEHTYLKHALTLLDPADKPRDVGFDILWGRCSTFTLHTQHKFYLLEIFLPGLFRYCV